MRHQSNLSWNFCRFGESKSHPMVRLLRVESVPLFWFVVKTLSVRAIIVVTIVRLGGRLGGNLEEANWHLFAGFSPLTILGNRIHPAGDPVRPLARKVRFARGGSAVGVQLILFGLDSTPISIAVIQVISVLDRHHR